MNSGKKVILLRMLAAICFIGFTGGPAAGGVKLVKGQTVYVPSYSNIVGELHSVLLQANLIIHNTDPQQPITLVRADHYDTNGKLVEHYLSKPLELGPLAATRITIKKLERGEAGAGANFMVQWRAQNPVTEPIVESIMIGSMMNQGHSFSSQGRVIYEE